MSLALFLLVPFLFLLMSFSGLYLPFVFADCSIFLPYLSAFLAFSPPASHQFGKLSAYVPSNSTLLTSLLIIKMGEVFSSYGTNEFVLPAFSALRPKSLEEEWLSFPACPAGGCPLLPTC